MARHPSGSDQLRHQPKPHHYKSTPQEERGADHLLEQLAKKLALEKGITVAEARRELRHWV